MQLTINNIELVEIQYKVEEDDLTYMGILTFEKDKVPDEEEISRQIQEIFNSWKLVIRPPIEEE
jgi:hypothetical protein